MTFCPPEDIGLDAFERVIFGGWHLFQSGSVDDYVDPFEGTTQAGLVANVTDKVAQGRVLIRRKLLAHFVLFQLVAGVDHDTLYARVFFQEGFSRMRVRTSQCPLLSKRSCYPATAETSLPKVDASSHYEHSANNECGAE